METERGIKPMKDKIRKLIEAKKKELENVRSAMIDSDSKEERMELGKTLDSIKNELEELERIFDEMDEPKDDGKGAGDQGGQPAGDQGGARSALDVVAAHRAAAPTAEKRNVDKFDTPEYRNAFMQFVTHGTPIPQELRQDAVTTTTDASAVIPTTTLNEIVSEMKVYGNLFDEVRKLNVKGGVNIPVLSLKPSATWITADTGTSQSDTQKLQAKTAITFNYYGLECKIAQTLLVNVTTYEAFQALFVPLAAEAMAQALDVAIMNGSGNGQPTGITVDTRVPAANVITMSSADIASWSAWKKKVFAKMKKAYRNGKFYMSQATFDGYIDGMTDSTGQPIGRVNYGIDGDERYRFGGKIVDTVEDDVLKSYDDASENDVIAVFFKPTDYAINSNMQMTTVRWTDHDTNEIKNKAIMICDGKLIDANGVLIIKKGAAVANAGE